MARLRIVPASATKRLPGPLAVLLIITLGVAGCGGGGGAGGGSTAPPVGGGSTGISYTGSEAQAGLSSTNAARFLDALLGSSAISGDIAGAEAGAPGSDALKQFGRPSPGAGRPQQQGLLIRIREIERRVERAALGGRGTISATAINVDQTDNCAASGTVRSNGRLSDAAIGTLTLTFNACDEGGGSYVMSGVATLTIRRYPPQSVSPDDTTLTFDDLTLRKGTQTLRIRGRFDDTISQTTGEETLTVNFTSRDEQSGITTDLRNMVVKTNVVLNTSGFREHYSGRVYLSDLGYAELRTVNDLFYSLQTLTFPDGGGPLLLDGGNSSHIELAVMSGRVAQLRVDRNGDGAFEDKALLEWTDLGADIGRDIADSDGDGMHNSWEVRYGLNPNSASDAAQDLDGDGISNRVEYLGVTRPDMASSVPKGPADVAITMLRTSAPIAATGDKVTYVVTAANSGPRATQGLQVRVTASSARSLTVGNTNDWGCFYDGELTLNCGIGPLESGSSTSVMFTAQTGLAAGSLTFSASSRADTLDPESGNDSTSETTQVREQAFATQQLLGTISGISFDATRGHFFVVRIQSDGFRAVEEIDPATATVVRAAAGNVTGSESAVSADGTTLYFASSTSEIGRTNLTTQTEVGRYPISATGSTSQTTIHKLLVPPTLPHLVIAQLEGTLTTRTVEVFDNGRRLPNFIVQSNPRSMVFDDDGSTLYVFDINVESGETPGRIRAYRVSDDGLTLLRTVRDHVPGNGIMSYAAGRLVTEQGAVVDATSGALLATLPLAVPGPSFTPSATVVASASSRRIFAIERGTGRLLIYGLDSLSLEAAVTLPFVCLELQRWGTDGLACRTETGVEFGRSPLIGP